MLLLPFSRNGRAGSLPLLLMMVSLSFLVLLSSSRSSRTGPLLGVDAFVVPSSCSSPRSIMLTSNTKSSRSRRATTATATTTQKKKTARIRHNAPKQYCINTTPLFLAATAPAGDKNDNGSAASSFVSSSSLEDHQEASSATTNNNNNDSNTDQQSTAAAASATVRIPSYRQLVTFCSTTILIWLSEPLLSLVDTTVVGLTQGASSTVQLAALGPATTFTDSLLYLTYFLSIATTNRIAAERAVHDHRQLQRTTSHVLAVSVVLGCLVTAISLAAGPTLLRHMAGRSASPTLLSHAVRYVWIRSLAGVAAVAGMTMQSFCLAVLDTRTPAVAVAAAALTNVAGDLLLAPRWGVQGAAVATAASSVVSAAILLRAVRRTLKGWREREVRKRQQQQQQQQLRQTQQQEQQQEQEQDKDIDDDSAVEAASSSVNSTDSTAVNATAFEPQPTENQSALPVKDDVVETKLSQTNSTSDDDEDGGDTQPIPMLSLPDKKAALKLVALAGPIFYVIMAKVACYGAMTVRCTAFGVQALAAHSIMMRIFFFFSTFGDSLSQTAQSFLPATLYPPPGDKKGFAKILRRLLVLAVGLAVANSQIAVRVLKHFGRYLTTDAAIVGLMRDHTGFMGASILLHPFIILLEGTVIASRNFRSLVIIYTATLAMHFGILLSPWSGSFPAVWRVFFLFQSTRLGLYAYRVWWGQRKAQMVVAPSKETTADTTATVSSTAAASS